VLAAMEKAKAVSDANQTANRLHELRKRIVCDVAEYAGLIEANSVLGSSRAALAALGEE
jgi:hypothetical protein